MSGFPTWAALRCCLRGTSSHDWLEHPMSNDNIGENRNERGGAGSNNSHRPSNPPKSEQQPQEPRRNKQPQPGDTDDKSGRQPQGSPR
jgi:hypothetical protein